LVVKGRIRRASFAALAMLAIMVKACAADVDTVGRGPFDECDGAEPTVLCDGGSGVCRDGSCRHNGDPCTVDGQQGTILWADCCTGCIKGNVCVSGDGCLIGGVPCERSCK